MYHTAVQAATDYRVSQYQSVFTSTSTGLAFPSQMVRLHHVDNTNSKKSRVKSKAAFVGRFLQAGKDPFLEQLYSLKVGKPKTSCWIWY